MSPLPLIKNKIMTVIGVSWQRKGICHLIPNLSPHLINSYLTSSVIRVIPCQFLKQPYPIPGLAKISPSGKPT